LSLPGNPDRSPPAARPAPQPYRPARPAPAPPAGESRAARLRRVWRRGAVPCGLLAIGLAGVGQMMLSTTARPVLGPTVLAALPWYLAGIAVLLLGWWGSYVNLSGLWLPRAAVTTLPVRWVRRPGNSRLVGLLRLAGAALALGATFWATHLLEADWSSTPGLALWLASVGLLVLVCAGERGRPGPAWTPERDSVGAWHPSRGVEIGLVAGLLVLAAALRLWRLGDLAPGMHGDEGEAGSAALQLLAGHPASPFTPGWMNQPNWYYWSVALGIQLFGSNLAGLRAFAVGAGLVTVLFVYLTAREMFGPRAAVMAGAFAAFSSAAILFSRQEFSNGTLPAGLAITAYCVLRGLRTRRHGDFVFAGLAAGFAVYYFAGGRLVALVAVALFAYLLLRHAGFLTFYGTRVAAFLLAYYLASAPFWAYDAAHPTLAGQYPFNRFVWLHYDELAARYQTTEWTGILWHQLVRTLSILTHGVDVSAMGALDYPIAQPIEAVLIVLGVAWAAWRWRDTRFALISLWFWTSIVLGGVLTMDAPNLPRIVGILAILPIIMASVLDHLVTQGVALLAGAQWTPAVARRGQVVGNALAAAVLVVAGLGQAQMFLGYYLNTHQNPIVTMQAAYVQQHVQNTRFYNLGAPLVYWTHGDNRYLNPQADGADLANVTNGLPIVDNGPTGEKDVVFLVWPVMADYLPLLQTYYPGGTEERVDLGDTQNPGSLLIAYHVPQSTIAAHRAIQARYVPPSGLAIDRPEPAFGQAGTPPPTGLRYPAAATWTGGLVAPSYDTYQFELQAPPGAQLVIDGLDVFSPTQMLTGTATATLVLARGPHSVQLRASLAGANTLVALRWAPGLAALAPIARQYLWDNHTGRAWTGEIQPMDPLDPLLEESGDVQNPHRQTGVDRRRVDGFLGFRDTGTAFGPGRPLSARWTTTVRITQGGAYTFALHSNGDSILSVDGKPVVDNVLGGTRAHQASGTVALMPGVHSVEVRYAWLSELGYLECWWTPPGAARQLLLAPGMSPAGPSAWRPDEVPPPTADAPAAAPPAASSAAGATEIPLAGLPTARGLAVGPSGYLYIGDEANGRIVVLDAHGTAIGTFGSPGRGPGQFLSINDLQVGPDRRLYVLDSRIPRIQRFTLAGKLESSIEGKGWCSPAGFTVAADGQVVVADTCNSTLEVYDRTGALVLTTQANEPPAQHFDQPTDAGVGADGSLFATDLRGRLVQLGADGRYRQSWTVPIGAAGGATKLVVGGDVVYLTDPDQGTVTAVVPASGLLSILAHAGKGPGELSTPTSIALGPDGRIYVLDAGNLRVQIFAPLATGK